MVRILRKKQILDRLKKTNIGIYGDPLSIDIYNLLNTHKDKISFQEMFRIAPFPFDEQSYNIKMHFHFSLQCPQHSYPPIQIKADLYSTGTGEQKNYSEIKFNTRHDSYKLDVYCGTRSFYFGYNSPLAKQVFINMYLLYKDRQR